MAKNLGLTYFDSTHKAARKAEVPTADFDGAANLGISSGVGVCTGVFNFSEDNFSYGQYEYVQSQYIGQNEGSATIVRDGNLPQGTTQFVKSAVADTAPGDAFETGLLNLTGFTVPMGGRAFGVRS
jgi:hypothetical protein